MNINVRLTVRAETQQWDISSRSLSKVKHLSELALCTRLYFTKASIYFKWMESTEQGWSLTNVNFSFILWCFIIHQRQQITICTVTVSDFLVYKTPHRTITLFYIINCTIRWILKCLLTGKKNPVQKLFHINNRGMVDYKQFRKQPVSCCYTVSNDVKQFRLITNRNMNSNLAILTSFTKGVGDMRTYTLRYNIHLSAIRDLGCILWTLDFCNTWM